MLFNVFNIHCSNVNIVKLSLSQHFSPSRLSTISSYLFFGLWRVEIMRADCNFIKFKYTYICLKYFEKFLFIIRYRNMGWLASQGWLASFIKILNYRYKRLKIYRIVKVCDKYNLCDKSHSILSCKSLNPKEWNQFLSWCKSLLFDACYDKFISFIF